MAHFFLKKRYCLPVKNMCRMHVWLFLAPSAKELHQCCIRWPDWVASRVPLCFVPTYLIHFLNLAFPCLFFLYLFSLQLIVNKICQWPDSNRRIPEVGGDRSTICVTATAPPITIFRTSIIWKNRFREKDFSWIKICRSSCSFIIIVTSVTPNEPKIGFVAQMRQK